MENKNPVTVDRSVSQPGTSFARACAASIIALAALTACSVTPPSELEAVRVDARKIAMDHSSFSAHVAAARVDQTFAAALEAQTPTVTRLESSIVQSLGGGAENLRIGDSVSRVGMWGSPVRFGGMQYGTQTESRRTDLVNSSELATSGMAVIPTVADALFASLSGNDALSAQSLSVKRSLRGSGDNGLGLTAQDALGRTQTIDAPILSSVRLVDEGCNDYSVGFGKVRRDYALASNAYGPTFANTTVACGAPLGFTIEGHGEYLADEVAALGLGFARKVGPLGTASLAFASSHADAGSGWLARVGFEHRNPWFNVAVGSRMQSREFRDIRALAMDDPIMQRDLASIGINVSDGATVSLSYASQTTWQRARSDLIAIRHSVSLGTGSLSMSAGHSRLADVGSSVFISYQRTFGFGIRRGERSELEEFDLNLLTRPLQLPTPSDGG